MRNYHLKLDKRMFDFPHFYEEVANNLPDGAVIAEVGVATGASAIFLAEQLLNQGKIFTFYLIDNLAYGGDMQLRTLLKNICLADLGHLVEVVPVSSVEGACRFPDRHFDFVFVDASHRIEWTKADILLWMTKVKVGGILAGHDYNRKEGIEVKMAVDTMFPTTKLVGEERRRDFEVIQTQQGLNVWKVIKTEHLRMRVY